MKLEQREGLIKSIKNRVLNKIWTPSLEAPGTTATALTNKSYNELINAGKIDIIISGHDHDQQLISIPDKPTMI